MPNFPIQRTERTLPGTTGAVRARLDVGTGEELVAGAVAGLGRGITALGIKFDIMEADTQFTKAKRLAREEINRLALSFNTNFDPATYQAELDKSLDTIQSFLPKNQRAASEFDKFYQDRLPSWQKGVEESTRARLKDNSRAEGFNLQQEAVRTGFSQTYFTHLEKGRTLGIYTSEEATKLRSDVVRETEWQAGIWWTENNPEQLIRQMEAPEKYYPNLTVQERVSLKSRAETQLSRLQTEARLEQQQRDDAISEGFLDLLINKLEPNKPQLTFSAIVESDLSFDVKKEWLTTLRTFDNYSEEELKEAFTDQGHVLADIYDKIDKGTLTDELDTMVGRGLNPVTAQRIKKEIRAPYEKDTEQLFKRIFGWSPELGFENDLSSFLYEKSLREWQAEVKRQDATGEKIIEIGRSIVRPYFLEHLKAVMPSDTNISRMMELALGEAVEIREEVPLDVEPTTEELERYRKLGVKKYRSPSGKLYDLTTTPPRVVVEGPVIIPPRAKVPAEPTVAESALTGELGTLKRPDGGVSTEISITVTDKRLNAGKPTNIPTLVKGQIDVDDLLAGKDVTKEQQEIAINRAIERVAEGQELPAYKTIEEAAKEAKARSLAKPEAEGPETYADFRAEVIRLKAVNMETAREYYDKWRGKFE